MFPEDAALSPLDGRYRSETAPLAKHLSEEALNKYRLHVEVEWLIYFASLFDARAPLTDEEKQLLRDIPLSFDADMRDRLAQFEAETRHDVKAVEYFLAEQMRQHPDTALPSWVQAAHIFATSEDINNLAHALGVRDAVQQVWIPAAQTLVDELREMAKNLAAQPMLARTHGQPATPTTLGKELAVFAHRLDTALDRVRDARYYGKFNGATGTFSAHALVLPDVDWPEASRTFVEGLGLTWNPLTTQIESHDWQVRLFADITHFNRIAHNLATDMWQYISWDSFGQKLEGHGSTGSSTMPHKVNPIRFENAEANFELSNAVLESLRDSLSTSRQQRDLSDSSSQRNVGVGFGYSLLALINLVRGLKTVEANESVLAADLDAHPEVIAEAIQQALRIGELLAAGKAETAGVYDDKVEVTTAATDGPYEKLKKATRGKHVTLEDLHALVAAFTDDEMPPSLKDALVNLRPATYIGLAETMVDYGRKFGSAAHGRDAE